MNSFELARDLLRSALQLGDRADQLTPESPLMGSFPEFNSLTVVGLMTGVEEQLGCEIDDTEITEEIFETVGSLAQFIEKKMDECS
jgi:acyl carrier protein